MTGTDTHQDIDDLGLTTAAALQGILEAAPDGILVVDSGGRIVLANQVTERMFGYARGELLGMSVDGLVPEPHRVVHARHRSEYLRDPRARPMGEGRELSGRRKDGTEFAVEISLSPLTTPKGMLVVSIVRDTSHRRQAEAKFRGLLESAPDGIVVVDASGSIVIVNSQAERMFDYPREELIGRPVELLVPTRYASSHVPHRVGYFDLPKTRPMGAGQALTGRKRDGTEFPVEISLSPLDTEQGVLVTAIVRDITERRAAEEQLKASLREKEVLLQEIHHRVKNNLQVTSSLLKLQSAHVADPEVRALFTESQNRIRSMALVHEKLYRSSELSRVDLADYTRSLADLLFRSFATDRSRIGYRVVAERVHLTIDAAVPCGLVLNELLCNALKHAFPDARAGTITVRITRAAPGAKVVIGVEDDGVGLPEGFDLARTESLGLELVQSLVAQLHGTLEVHRRPTTRFLFRFAAPEEPS